MSPETIENLNHSVYMENMKNATLTIAPHGYKSNSKDDAKIL